MRNSGEVDPPAKGGPAGDTDVGRQDPLDLSTTEWRVGYRRPPLATRFPPGQSGNPRGSRKRAGTFGAAMAAALGEKVDVKENGRSRRITKLEAAAKQLANHAASGIGVRCSSLSVCSKPTTAARRERRPNASARATNWSLPSWCGGYGGCRDAGAIAEVQALLTAVLARSRSLECIKGLGKLNCTPRLRHWI